MPKDNPNRFGKHGGFPGQGKAVGRPDFVDLLIPFDRDPPPPPPPPECVEVSIDVGLPSPTNPTVIALDASDAAYCFTDSFMDRTSVLLTGFGADDVINVTSASADDYQFSQVGGREEDLVLTALIGAELYRIIIEDVIPPGAVVTDYASAIAAVGHEFITFDDEPNLPPDTCWAGSLEYGTLGETPVVATAFGLPYCFQDDAAIESNVAIYNFGPDDTVDIGIVADPNSEYLFSAIDFGGGVADDLLLRSYVIDDTGAQVITGEIILVDLLPDGATVDDYATAYEEVGFYFLALSPPPGESLVQSIDVGEPTGMPVTFVASGNPHRFTEDISVSTNVVIQGFTSDDIIEVTGLAIDEYNFGYLPSDSNSLRITYNDGTRYTEIVLDSVLFGTTGFVFDYDSAVAALGYDFMVVG